MSEQNKQEQSTPDEQAKTPITYTIHVVIDEFPVDVQIVGGQKRLLNAIKGLREIGAVPPSLASNARAERAQEAPRCPYHGPMKESSKRPGTWFCSQRMGDGSYCKEKA